MKLKFNLFFLNGTVWLFDLLPDDLTALRAQELLQLFQLLLDQFVKLLLSLRKTKILKCKFFSCTGSGTSILNGTQSTVTS